MGFSQRRYHSALGREARELRKAQAIAQGKKSPEEAMSEKQRRLRRRKKRRRRKKK